MAKAAGTILLLSLALSACAVLMQYCLGVYGDYADRRESARLNRLYRLSLHEVGHLAVSWHLPSLAVPERLVHGEEADRCGWSARAHRPARTFEGLDYRFSLVAATTAGTAAERMLGRPVSSVREDRAGARRRAITMLEECDREGAGRGVGGGGGRGGGGGGGARLLSRLRRLRHRVTPDTEERALRVVAAAEAVAEATLRKRLPEVLLLEEKLKASGVLDRGFVRRVMGNRTSAAFDAHEFCREQNWGGGGLKSGLIVPS